MMDALDSDSPASLAKLKETPDLGAFAADSLRPLKLRIVLSVRSNVRTAGLLVVNAKPKGTSASLSAPA